jgi:DNA topoisomerase I
MIDLAGIPQSPYTLVICEKPDAARRIAIALGTSSFNERRGLPTPFFSIEDSHNQHFVVSSAVGHLYRLVDVNSNRSMYPVFDIKWAPISKTKNGSGSRSVQIIKSISLLSKRASKFVHACDYDLEGEVIGYNILQYACNNKYENSLRAKFSTLTDEEIRNSFDNLLKPSASLAEAGRSRHMIDFIYGVNLSRALTQSFKVSNNGKRYRNLSIGRVQGPTLAFVVDRETEIRNHVPEPFWTIYGKFEKDGQIIEAHYYQQKISTLSQATSILNACRNQDGKITKIEKQRVTLRAPTPFNLGDLQKEAYRVFRLSPSYTLTIAEKLYISALISYPRTSSQKLPTSINYKKIISGLSKIGGGGNYASLVTALFARDHLSPNEGSKTDPAHPAIYPTGEQPKGKLAPVELKLFDLIIRRFLATFGDPAISQNTTISILVKDEHIFKTDGKKILYEGWMQFYKPYVNRFGMDTSLPELHENDILKNIAIVLDKKFTQPPARFNEASLLEEMERKKIGTKATRSEVIRTLFKRNYITTTTTTASRQGENDRVGGKGIEATEIGFKIIQSMRRYIPNIVSTELTRSMEEQLEGIESGKARSSSVIDWAKDRLREAIVHFKENEIEIGREITEAVIVVSQNQQQQQQQRQTVLGTCPVCNKGVLKIIRSTTSKKRFVGCSNYSSGLCKATAPLPQKGSLKTTQRTCTLCRWPILRTIYPTKRHWEFCVNLQCPSKKKDIKV